MRPGTNYLLSCKRFLLQADERSRTSSFGIHTVLWQRRWMHLYLRYARSDRSLVFECILQSG